MLKSFIYRGSQPQPMAQPTPKRISTPAGQRLSVIMEGGGGGVGGGVRSSSTVAVDADADADADAEAGTGEPGQGISESALRPSTRITNSSYEHRVHHGDPPLFGEEKKPPSYMSGSNGGGEERDPNARPYSLLPVAARENMQQRGGWKRLMLMIAVAVAIILAIALGVGLGVGLSKKHHTSSSSPSSPSSTPSAAQPFPLGTWSFETFLTSVSTACTSNSALWTCAPYSTYTSSSPSSSAYTFSWEISSSGGSGTSSGYTISSTDPFGMQFSNIPLSLESANTAQERYTFSIPNTSKQVAAATSLFSDNAATVCFYNDTTVQASLYTRMPKSSTASSSSSAAGSMQQQSSGVIISTWPYAVHVDTVANGGSGVPSCYMSVNGVPTGQAASLPDEPSSSSCACVYSNFDLS